MRFQVLYRNQWTEEWEDPVGDSLTADELAQMLPELIEEFGCIKVREA